VERHNTDGNEVKFWEHSPYCRRCGQYWCIQTLWSTYSCLYWLSARHLINDGGIAHNLNVIAVLLDQSPYYFERKINLSSRIRFWNVNVITVESRVPATKNLWNFEFGSPFLVWSASVVVIFGKYSDQIHKCVWIISISAVVRWPNALRPAVYLCAFEYSWFEISILFDNVSTVISYLERHAFGIFVLYVQVPHSFMFDEIFVVKYNRRII
jgi:hypothetical protein